MFTSGTRVSNYKFTVSLMLGTHTPQDNQADFGPISPLTTILGNVLTILIILSDFPVVRGVLRMAESARKIVEYLRSEILMGGDPENCRSSRETKPYSIRKRADWSKTNAVKAQHKRIWTLVAISYGHYQRLALCHYFKTFNILFESFVIIYTCLRKYNFLIAFSFSHLFRFRLLLF